MIRFGLGILSQFGEKKYAKKCFAKLFLCLIVCLSFLLSSCSGWWYHFQCSREELETDLLSIEVIKITYDFNDDTQKYTLIADVISVIDETAQREEILQTLSNVKFHGRVGPDVRESQYGLKFNYPSRSVVFSLHGLHRYDENHIWLPQESHHLEMQEQEYEQLLEQYLPDAYSERFDP